MLAPVWLFLRAVGLPSWLGLFRRSRKQSFDESSAFYSSSYSPDRMIPRSLKVIFTKDNVAELHVGTGEIVFALIEHGQHGTQANDRAFARLTN